MKNLFKKAGQMAFAGLMASILPMASHATPVIPVGTSVSVTDVTDWGTTPMQIVYGYFPVIGYNGGVYAGINDLSLRSPSINGGVPYTAEGFCIDPYHYSDSGPDYDTAVALQDGPKSPGPMSPTAATKIEQLWYEMYAPNMTSLNAAILQVAIWDLVSQSVGDPVDFNYGDGTTALVATDAVNAINDLQPTDPKANLVALTGPSGQDYVVSAPDGGTGLFMLAGSLAALVLASHVERKRALNVSTSH